MIHPFAALEKNAGSVGRLLGAGVKSLWHNGAWNTLGHAATKGIARGGAVGQAAKMALPVANTMGGTAGKALGWYGVAGLASPALGVDLPGSSLAMNLGMPIIGAMHSGANLINASRAGSAQGQAAIQKDVETGAGRAAQDFISGLHIDPRVANDPEAYRSFSEQIGRGMRSADTYARGGYKPMGGFSQLQHIFEGSDDLIKNRVRMKIQGQLPALMKGAGIGSIIGNTMKGLSVAGATAGLGSAILSKKPHDAEAMQNEGYSAAQAAIQNRLKNMSSVERMATRWDPTFAADAIAKKFPGVMKSWESQYGPLQRGGLSSLVNNFQNGGTGAKFYSTDAAGTRNFIN
jgi:hypothetical protein